MRKNNKGFTLTELIIAIAIIAILASILAPSALHYISRSKDSRAVTNCKTLVTSATSVQLGYPGYGAIADDKNAWGDVLTEANAGPQIQLLELTQDQDFEITKLAMLDDDRYVVYEHQGYIVMNEDQYNQRRIAEQEEAEAAKKLAFEMGEFLGGEKKEDVLDDVASSSEPIRPGSNSAFTNVVAEEDRPVAETTNTLIASVDEMSSELMINGYKVARIKYTGGKYKYFAVHGRINDGKDNGDGTTDMLSSDQSAYFETAFDKAIASVAGSDFTLKKADLYFDENGKLVPYRILPNGKVNENNGQMSQITFVGKTSNSTITVAYSDVIGWYIYSRK